jgi:hypothetical protein
MTQPDVQLSATSMRRKNWGHNRITNTTDFTGNPAYSLRRIRQAMVEASGRKVCWRSTGVVATE